MAAPALRQVADVFLLQVVSQPPPSTATISPPQPYNTGNGAFDVNFVYTVGNPPAVKPFQIAWRKDAVALTGNDVPTASFSPPSPERLQTAMDYRGHTVYVPVGAAQRLTGRITGELPDDATAGTYTATITMLQPE